MATGRSGRRTRCGLIRKVRSRNSQHESNDAARVVVRGRLRDALHQSDRLPLLSRDLRCVLHPHRPPGDAVLLIGRPLAHIGADLGLLLISP